MSNSTAFLATLVLQAAPMSQLELVAVVVVIAVFLLGSLRLLNSVRARRRGAHRSSTEHYSALHMFREEPRRPPDRFQPQRPPSSFVPPVAPARPTGSDATFTLETGEEVESGAVRFHRPPEGTLQLLPGRLEILAGTDTRAEIRFVKMSGREAAVTFGRDAGEPHAHVQLQSPTVSRLHARMHYDDGVWRVANLSRTNPVLINGRDLSGNGNDHPLKDGDRVEMGEIVFRYRAR
jgi:hypothetical protein